MQLLYYSSGDDENARRLKAAVHKVIPAGRIEHFTKLDDFQDRLRMIVEPDSVAVLSAPDLGELQEMQQFRKLLTEVYVILVLPDRGKATIALAHHLLPRFLSQKDSDFADLKVVLNRMYDNSKKSHDWQVTEEA